MNIKISSMYAIEEGIELNWEITLMPLNVTGRLIIIDGIHTNYIITRNAEVYNIKTGKKLKFGITNVGYYYVNIQLGKRGNYKSKTVHRLVAQAYIPNPNNYPVVNHINGNKLDPSVSNLEWCTFSDNNQHAFDTGLKKPTKGYPGESCNFATHTEEEALQVCNLLQEGYSPKAVSKLFGCSHDFVEKIYARKTWTHISKDFSFEKVLRYSKYFTFHEVDEFERLFDEGYSVREAILEMGYKYNEKNRGRVKQLRKVLRRLKNTENKYA